MGSMGGPNSRVSAWLLGTEKESVSSSDSGRAITSLVWWWALLDKGLDNGSWECGWVASSNGCGLVELDNDAFSPGLTAAMS
jgi:hypothetical protein